MDRMPFVIAADKPIKAANSQPNSSWLANLQQVRLTKHPAISRRSNFSSTGNPKREVNITSHSSDRTDLTSPQPLDSIWIGSAFFADLVFRTTDEPEERGGRRFFLRDRISTRTVPKSIPQKFMRRLQPEEVRGTAKEARN